MARIDDTLIHLCSHKYMTRLLRQYLNGHPPPFVCPAPAMCLTTSQIPRTNFISTKRSNEPRMCLILIHPTRKPNSCPSHQPLAISENVIHIWDSLPYKTHTIYNLPVLSVKIFIHSCINLMISVSLTQLYKDSETPWVKSGLCPPKHNYTQKNPVRHGLHGGY